MKRAKVLLAFLGVAAMLVVPARPAAAATTDGTAEGRFLTLLNMARTGSSKSMLVLDSAASGVSRNWSYQMAAANKLSHNPNYASQISTSVTSQWTRLGENVGVGSTADGLHQAFWNSSGHRANVLGDYNRVGIGAVQEAGKLWVTFNFIKGPGISGSTGVNDCSAPGYLLDGYGGIHSVGGATPIANSGYWNNWDIARDLTVNASGAGFKLDGFGGLHPVGSATPIRSGGYWGGWDIATAASVTPDGKGVYVLDGYGGIHNAGTATPVKGSGYWLNWRIARDIQVNPATGNSGYVLDGFGGLHPFGGAPATRTTGYWPADKARTFEFLPDGTGGYVVDVEGGLWPFAVGNESMPATPARLTPIEPGTARFGLVKNGATTVVTASGARLGLGNPCATSAPWGSWDILRGAVSR